MRIVINQSNYFPWIGYFALMAAADTFIFLDDVQYTTRDWRNRNKIRSSASEKWISIPCGHNRDRLINEVYWTDETWRDTHWQKIENSYKRAPFFQEHADFIYALLHTETNNLSSLNQRTIIEIFNKFLPDLLPTIKQSKDFSLTSKASNLMLDLCHLNQATNYLSGPTAKSYLDIDNFKLNNITVSWADYTNLLPTNDNDDKIIYSILDSIFLEADGIQTKVEDFLEKNKQPS